MFRKIVVININSKYFIKCHSARIGILIAHTFRCLFHKIQYLVIITIAKIQIDIVNMLTIKMNTVQILMLKLIISKLFTTYC